MYFTIRTNTFHEHSDEVKPAAGLKVANLKSLSYKISCNLDE